MADAPAAPRPSSTRGRPPTYAATTLDPMCHAWFKEPKHDPRIPTQTLGTGHQNHYKDACLRRILEAAAIPDDARSRLTKDDIKDILRTYLNHPETNLTDDQRIFLMTEYYTDAYLDSFYTHYRRSQQGSTTNASASASAPSAALAARFQPIQSKLKKLKYFNPESITTILNYLFDLKDVIRYDLLPNESAVHLVGKVNILTMVYLLTAVVRLILTLEQSKYLKPRFIANLLHDVKSWTDSFKPHASYPMSKFKHYMATFLQLLNVYLSTKQQHGNLYVKLNPEAFLDLLRAIKIKCMTIFGLQSVANTPTFIQTTLDYINGVEEREVYQYIWFLLTEQPLDYPKRPIRLVPPEDLESQCLQMVSGVQDTYETAFKSPFLQRCSALIQTDCETLTKQRGKLMKTLQSKYTITTPRYSDYLENSFQVQVRRPHALMDFFKQWVAYAVIGKQRNGFWLKYLDVTFEGEEGYFIGVQTDLLQTCMDTLHPAKKTFASPFLLPVEDGSARHRFARDIAFLPEDITAFQGFLDLTAPESKQLFYEFVGGLMARCFLEHIELPVKLSYFTLAYLFTNGHFQPDDYGFYFMMDMPNAAKSYVNLLAYDASIIDALDMTENDVYPLAGSRASPASPKASPKAITADTLIPYIHRFGQYALLSVQPGDPPVIPPEDAAKYEATTAQYRSYLAAWAKGFFIQIYHTKASEETTIRLIDPLISTGGTPDLHQLAHWVKTLVVPQFYEINGTPKRNQEIAFQQIIFQWVIHDLLGNPLLPLPYDAILPEGTPPPTTPEAKKRFYYTQFIPQLLYFWTGSRTLNMSYKHTVQFILNDPTDIPDTAPAKYTKKYERLNAHPLAHTCSKTLDIPTYLIDLSRQKRPGESLEQLFQRIKEERMVRTYLNALNDRWKTILLRRLCTAMYQSHGFGMAGGARKEKHIRPKKSKPKK